MIGISKLYCNTVEPSDVLRYGRKTDRLPAHLLQFAEDKRPVVILNLTRRCNLRCVHCYAAADGGPGENELSTDEWLRVIDELTDFGCPVALFSGGEPLILPDIVRLVRHAVERDMRAVVSTNGTLISPDLAGELADAGLSYAGVSIDGDRGTHDAFRGRSGAYDQTLAGIDTALAAGLKTGLRFTITRRNAADIPAVFDLLERTGIPRICFYHLVYTGRGEELTADTLDHAATRRVVDSLIDRTADLYSRGITPEVLTVDNHADGPYLYLRLLKENPERAKQVLELLSYNGGNSSGVGVAAIGWEGNVHPDQFWSTRILGNIRERPFADIWTDRDNEFLMRLKHKADHVTGRCASCRFLSVCGGNFRARAEAATGDPWAPDPECYLTDEEIIGDSGE